ncbi:ankyrin repeat-containing protein At5g02620-like [Gastrolobium bilobum]|uniref:ankyrin repeat-containing protein At5g02620-like n=1 Tax=Gastrolobium bilobum TaxID=150636 RepID=UPI002AB15831|nr:ankyrin repeat-containing protein At5g02620-like [Gastrolobium bilobum]
MDPKFLDAIRKNDITTFSSLVKENEGILNQRTADSFNTPLHLASMYGCTEMVSEIVGLCPDMISAENKNMETPIHEACRQENVKVLMLMLGVNPTAACKLNPTCKSAFFLACSLGHLDLVNLLLNLSEMVEPEAAGFDQTCIQIAVSRGHTDVVRELLNKRPELTQVIEDNGNSLLHNASSKGHREIVWILQRRDPNLALQYNNNGYTPLHLAVMNGKVSILYDFVSSCATSFHYLTREEETVLHLAVRYGCYDALVFLVEVCNGTNLLHCHDRYGNSVLHLAVTGGRNKIAEFLIIKTKLDINTRNSEGKTALDILDQAKDSAENRQLQATFIRAGGKRNFQPSSWSLEVDKANSLSPIASKLSLSQRYIANEMEVPSEMVSYDCTSPPEVSKSMESRSPQPQVSERFENGTYKPYYFSPTTLGKHKHQKKRKTENLNQLYYTERNMYHEMHKEALLNARNTIVLVAVLIATVTFAAGISPPGGVYQEGRMGGKSMVGKTTAFKVFAISNNIALFTSLSIVIVLVSIIPFRRKPQTRLLTIAHKVMWIAVAFMATGYVAATWVILPHSKGMQWLSVVLLALGGGSLGTIFIGLGVMLVEHWLRKSKWRKTRKESGDGAADLERKSVNSDFESSYLQGYHSY